MPDDNRTRELDISEWLPAQRAVAERRSTPSPALSSSPGPRPTEPVARPIASHRYRYEADDLAWHTGSETMVLPVFVTRAASDPVGARAEASEPVAAAPSGAAAPNDDDRLPSDERNMLIFVTVLLAIGTLAIVAMASIGR